MPKKEKKRGFTIQGFDAEHYKQTEGYVNAIDELYNTAISEYAQVAGKVKLSPYKPFSFSDYPQAKAKANQIMADLSSKMKSVIVRGARNQWLYACKKNDSFLESIINTSKVPRKTLEKWQDLNLDALGTFQTRKINGLGLSDRIWNYAGQMKDQMELGIDIALGDGRSAQALSRDLRQYLVDPDKLFRRVRDKYGNLKLSKAAKAYHPGQGKYRSSYKNAMRLTRSEINMAYRESDQLRWQQLDFIVGFEVKLSNNHTLNGMPFSDICDTLAGKYPKDFKFVGWHPQCRCFKVPIMMDRDEFNTDELNELKAAINGTEYNKLESRNTVPDLPTNFKDWVNDNIKRSQNWTSQPYFIRDNFEGGILSGGIKLKPVEPIKPTKPVKPIKTQAQIDDIQSRWNTRVATNTYGSQIEQLQSEFPTVDAISDHVKAIKAQIKAGASVDQISLMVDELKNKVEVKKAWDIRLEENKLGKLIPDVKGFKAKFKVDELQNVYNAVEAKLATIDGLSLEMQKKKLEFEVDFVEQKKKYSTWEVAQGAYKKKLVEVEYKIAKNEVSESVVDSFNYAKTTMSKNVKQMAAELKDLLDKNAPLAQLEAKSNALNIEVQKLEAKKIGKKAKAGAVKIGNIDETNYTQDRKDKAFWALVPDDADNKFREYLKKTWAKASIAEKQAAYRYTAGSGGYNRPLRGYDQSWYNFKGVGKVSLDNEGMAYNINALSSLIEKSTYDFDTWLQRGVDSKGMAANLGLDENVFSSMSQAQLQKSLMGKVIKDEAFVSCGTAKGKGFGGNIFNIYAPKGTKAIYAEPFSEYGGSKSKIWDGKSKTTLHYELETIIQKGTSFRITKVEKKYGTVYIDMEVVSQ